MLKLDGDGPLYVQAYRTLRRGILDGAFRPGDRLPRRARWRASWVCLAR